MRILKFGGSSVADPERIKNVTRIIRRYASEYGDISVVISAQSGVTNQLVKLGESIKVRSSDRDAVLKELEQRHLNAVKALLPIGQTPSAMAEIITIFNELEDIAK